jgi:hypothetical protein
MQPFLFCVLTLTILSAAQYPEPATRQTVHPQLQLRVKSDRQVYSIRDKIRLELEVRNVGNDSIYVPRSSFCLGSGGSGQLEVQILNSLGREVRGVIRDCLPVPPLPPKPGEIFCDTAEYILLAPSSFFGFLDELRVKEFMVKPGNYTLVIRYEGIMTDDLVPKSRFPLPYWTKDNEPLVSKLHISITP